MKDQARIRNAKYWEKLHDKIIAKYKLKRKVKKENNNDN